jgi:hypothetical protein
MRRVHEQLWQNTFELTTFFYLPTYALQLNL